MTMANDFKTIISVDNRSFVKGVKESEKSIKVFAKVCQVGDSNVKSFGERINSATAYIGKYAGGLGVAFGAVDTLRNIISSSKETQDAFNTVMGTAGEVTSQFFRSLTSGDWSIFGDGIDNAISKAKEYTETIRDMQRMFEVMQSRYDIIEADKTRLESIIEDESLSLKQRTEAYNQMDSLMTQSIEKFLQKLTTAKNELNSAISDKIGSNRYLNADNVNELQNIILDLRDPTSDLVKDLEEYKKAKDAATVKANWNVFEESGDEAYKRMQESARKFYSTYSKSEREKNDELLRLQNSLNDTMYQEWKEMIDNISQYAERVATWQKDLSGARDEITSATANAVSNSVTGNSNQKELEEAAEGSISYLNKQLSEWRKKFNDATSQEARLAAKRMINELEMQEIHMKVVLEYEEKNKPEDMKPKEGGSLAIKGRNPTEDIASGYIQVKGVDQGVIQSNYDYADALNAIYDAMYSVSRITSDGTAEWIRYSLTLVKSIESAIPTLKKFYDASKATAIAQGAASAASTPVIGWITAIGAITSMVAAFASIPKFANGGVIPGNMFSGDRVPVLANSGEMILNRTQQGYLFNILQSGGYRRKEKVQKVEFEIAYDKLIGVLKNGDRKARRMY